MNRKEVTLFVLATLAATALLVAVPAQAQPGPGTSAPASALPSGN